jgi:hypothetical protein
MPLFLTEAAVAQGTTQSPSENTQPDSKPKFNAARPGNATINANGQPIGPDSKVIPNADDHTKLPKNLSGGTGVNPYTGVPVGQPLRSNDIGHER